MNVRRGWIRRFRPMGPERPSEGLDRARCSIGQDELDVETSDEQAVDEVEQASRAWDGSGEPCSAVEQRFAAERRSTELDGQAPARGRVR